MTAPAEAAGFLVQMPVAVLADVAPMSHPDMEFLEAVAAALPNHSFEPLNGQGNSYQLGTAGLLTFQPSNRASNYTANGTRERRLEVRDFVRTNPIVEIFLTPAGETGLETPSEAMDILFIPQPPQGPPMLWQEPPLRFSEIGTELGDLARLAFPTTGFSDSEEPAESPSHEAVESLAVEPPPAEVVSEPPAEVGVVEPVVEAILEPEPAPVLIESAVPEVAPPVESKEQVQRPTPIPEPVTRPLPLTLQATAPAKGKTVQVFSSASKAVSVQVPRSSSPPLRATMSFGPAPAKNDVKPDVKVDAKKPVPAPPAARPEQPVPEIKKPAAKLLAPELAKQTAKAEISSLPKQPARVDAKQDKKPEVRENVRLKEEVNPQKAAEQSLPASLSPPLSRVV